MATPTLKKYDSAAAVWSRYLLLTACVFSFNGGVFAFFFPYASLSIWMPSRHIPSFLFNPICLPGVAALVAAFALPAIEYYTRTPASVKFVLCAGVFAPLLFMQLTLIPAATFMAIAGLGQLVAAFVETGAAREEAQKLLPGGSSRR
ncbi:hypothetical protein HDU87_007570 [Geranomyces variabilis]|uniref:Uncharacterized protein n=1 Tax=Geranomyces variabilis TaxID=109894 RepID=A0AAD5TE91_9FUNG|nr:hypothetical protein HDU87_007570 [Geranomyces variabilis]